MDEQRSSALTAASLDCPGSPAVGGADHAAKFADSPAALPIQEENSVERQWLTGRLHGPTLTAIRTVQHDRTGTASDPDAIALSVNCMKITARQRIVRQFEIGISP